jgi:hypothetical protein
MSDFVVRIKISMPDGTKTHATKINAVNLEDAMLRFAELAGDDNKFIAIKAIATSALNESQQVERTYGVVFPIASVLEVIYQEV